MTVSKCENLGSNNYAEIARLVRRPESVSLPFAFFAWESLFMPSKLSLKEGGLEMLQNSIATPHIEPLNSSVVTNQRGNTLLAVIAAASVIAVLMVASSQLFVSDQKELTETEDRRQLINTLDRIRIASGELNSCKLMLVGTSYPTSTGNAALASLNFGSETITSGATSGKITITSINLIDEAALPNTFDSTGNSHVHRRGYIEIKGVFASLRKYTFHKRFSVDVILDGANNITDCFRGQDNAQVACDVINGVGAYGGSPANCALRANGLTKGTCPANQCIKGFDINNDVICGAI